MDKKALALAIIKSGRSYQEAGEVTGLSLEKIMKAYKESKQCHGYQTY
jgi:hypothetical protein